jgi:hypothetical protein
VINPSRISHRYHPRSSPASENAAVPGAGSSDGAPVVLAVESASPVATIQFEIGWINGAIHQDWRYITIALHHPLRWQSDRCAHRPLELET